MSSTTFFPELNQTDDFSDCMSVDTSSSATMESRSSAAMDASSKSQTSTLSIQEQIANIKAEHAQRQAKLQAALSKYVQSDDENDEEDFDNEELWVEI